MRKFGIKQVGEGSNCHCKNITKLMFRAFAHRQSEVLNELDFRRVALHIGYHVTELSRDSREKHVTARFVLINSVAQRLGFSRVQNEGQLHLPLYCTLFVAGSG